MTSKRVEFKVVRGNKVYNITVDSDGGRVPRHARDLVNALDGGSYKQAQGTLTKVARNAACHDKHCCLGVASEICPVAPAFDVVPEYDGRPRRGFVRAYKVRGDKTGEQGALPPSVLKWIGFSDKSGSFDSGAVVINGKNFSSLVDLNDSGIPFAVIAKVIEQCPVGLVKRRPRQTSK